MSTAPMQPKMIRFPLDLWERVQQEARRESVREGQDVSASEWLRRAAEERLRKGG